MRCRIRWITVAIVAGWLFVAPSAHAETLPKWVQNHRPTSLWSGPDGGAIEFGTVPAWSGFEVLGAQGDRLFVHYLGNGVDREPGVAWVNGADVGPTDRPLLWVAAREPAALWSGPDEGAILFGFAPEEALMVRLGPAGSGRAQVFFLGAGDQHQAGLAWAELGALRPALAPAENSPLWQVWGAWYAQVAAEARRLAAPPPPPPSTTLTRPAWKPPSPAEQQQFIEHVAGVARRFRAEVGLPPSLVVAIAINESGWGQSALSQQAHNYFGIKAHRGPGTAGSVEYETWEVVDGQIVTIRAVFRAYHSLEESVRDLGAFLRLNVRYESVWEQAHDPQAAARALARAGYATDPAWPDKLISIMSRHNLTRFDG